MRLGLLMGSLILILRGDMRFLGLGDGFGECGFVCGEARGWRVRAYSKQGTSIC
jgi:hypothetical protein